MRKIRLGTLDSVAKLMACTCAQRAFYQPYMYGRYVGAGAYLGCKSHMKKVGMHALDVCMLFLLFCFARGGM